MFLVLGFRSHRSFCDEISPLKWAKSVLIVVADGIINLAFPPYNSALPIDYLFYFGG